MDSSKKTFAVIGIGQFGKSIVEELAKQKADVIAIDVDEERVRSVASIISTVYVADSTNEKALNELEIGTVDNAIVAFGDNLQATILTTVLLKDLGVKHLVVRVDDEYYVPIIKKLGADEIVSPQKLAGRDLANRLGNSSFIDYYSLAGDYSVVKVTIPNDFKSASLMELNPRNSYGVNVILIDRNKTTLSPKANDSIKPGDKIYIVGKKHEIEEFSEFLSEHK